MERSHYFTYTMLLALASCAGALAAPGTAFKDVPAGHWAAPAIAKATQKGLMRPAAAGRFNPSQPVTRAELASILVRVIDYLESQGPVKLSTSRAKPEVWPPQLTALARFPKTHPSYPALERLVKGGYLVPNARSGGFMPTPQNIDRPATAEEVAAAFAGAMVRITEKRSALEHPETLQEGDRPETRDKGDGPPSLVPHRH